MRTLERSKDLATGMLKKIKRHPFMATVVFVALFLAYQVVTLPFGEIRELRGKNPDETAFMHEQAERAKDQGKPFRKYHHWVPLKNIPKDVVGAVIVAEDGTFWSHEGFDWYELRESIERNIKEGRPARGASTISQQLVKNLFLSPSKNPLRKLKEWVLTWYVERELPKTRILELYLNLIEWGNGIYGVEAAARQYFGKSASQLTRQEGARLAAIIPSPRRHRADSQTNYVVRRANLILDRMKARGW